MSANLVLARAFSLHAPRSGRDKLRPSIIIPPTPVCTSHLVQQDTLNSATPSTALDSLPSSRSQSTRRDQAKDAHMDFLTTNMPAEVIAIGELFATMQHTLSTLRNTFDSIGHQTETMASLGPKIKAADQIKHFRAKFEEQIAKQEAEVQEIRLLLQSVVQDAFMDHLKAQVRITIQDRVAKEVKERVRQQLSVQIPENLRQPVKQKHETPTNPDACININIQFASPIAPLRPLLRPLPTPAQSPAVVVAGSFSVSHSTIPSPLTAWPQVPVSTPIVPSTLGVMVPQGNGLCYLMPPTPSPLIPRDLRSLFALEPDAVTTPLRNYINSDDFERHVELSPETPDLMEGSPTSSSDSGDTLVTSDCEEDCRKASDFQDRDMKRYIARTGIRSISGDTRSETKERPQLCIFIPG